MPWVSATLNPNSQQSLYGDTPHNRGENIFEQPLFWQNPDGTFDPGADPTKMREPDYQSDHNTMAGANVYTDQFKPLDGNPQWWNKVSNDPLIGGRNLADIPDWKSNPDISNLLQKAQGDYYQVHGTKSGGLIGGIFQDEGLMNFLKVVGAGTAVGGLMSGGLGAGAGTSGWTSGYDLAGGGSFGSSGAGLTGATGMPGEFNIEDFFNSWDSSAGTAGATNTTDFVGSDWASGVPGSSGPGMNNSFIQQLMNSGMNPQQSMKLAQLFGGGGGTPGTGIPNLLSGASGLFDLFGTGPYSAQGLNDAAAKTADPLKDDHAAYAGMLKGLMTNPGSFNLTPGAKFTMDTGTENLTRSDAARGLLGSGNILGDIMQFGEGVASKDYYTMIDKLTQLSSGSPALAGQIQSGQLANRNNALANVGGGLAPVPGSSTNSGGGVLQALGGIGSGISSIFNLFK